MLKNIGKHKTISIILLCLILVLVNLYLSNTWVEVNDYVLYPDKLPKEFDGYTIVQLSDLHLRNLKDLNRDLIGMAEKKAAKLGTRIDGVCITGDLIDSGRGILPQVIDYVGAIAKKYPVYFTGGNHDYEPGIQSFEKLLSEAGITVLENDAIQISAGSGHFWLVGVSDLEFRMNKEDLAFQNVPLQDFSITMIHEPLLHEKLTACGADLILTGHNHAGQFRLPFLPVLYAPGQGFLPKYGYGFYSRERPDQGKSVMYINKGIGFSGNQGLRFTNRPEIALFQLKKKSSE